MKKHGTVKITKKFLKTLGACDDGLAGAKKFIGSVISTDPVDNVELANRMEGVGLGPRIEWLAIHVDQPLAKQDDGYTWTYDVNHINGKHDPWVGAQILASIADHLLTARGK